VPLNFIGIPLFFIGVPLFFIGVPLFFIGVPPFFIGIRRLKKALYAVFARLKIKYVQISF
jgi:hypothetical protein